jgi:hypothetical protein
VLFQGGGYVTKLHIYINYILIYITTSQNQATMSAARVRLTTTSYDSSLEGQHDTVESDMTIRFVVPISMSNHIIVLPMSHTHRESNSMFDKT